MAETKQMPNANKLAMSRALGAAFLNHQVEQLEKSVSNGPGAGNWRARGQANGGPQISVNGGKRGGAPSSPGVKVATRKKGGGGEVQLATKERTAPTKSGGAEYERSVTRDTGVRRRSNEEAKGEKDADVIVVDASVLVHALYQVKKWCRDGRQEIIIVPLEALNTLDLLKKGTSPLAQRARAASRILEAQVGTNPRIRVQRDDAFLLWDSIDFKEDASEQQDPTAKSGAANLSPEWVRRTICCARWEVDHADETIKATNVSRNTNTARTSSDGAGKKPKVILAVLSSLPNLSPQLSQLKLVDPANDNGSTPLTPVPLPAPTLPQPNKHEPRSSGILVAHWAAKARIQLLEVEPTIPGRGGEDDAERSKRPNGNGNHHPHAHPHVHGHGAHGGYGKGRRGSATEGAPRVGLVERPPAVMAMMEMVAQPSKVVRVLARGEKLDPDP